MSWLTLSVCGVSFLQEFIRWTQRGVPGLQASLSALHLEHEDHLVHGAGGHDEGDPEGSGRQQLWLRAARALFTVLRARRRPTGQSGPVGDGGVQAAPPLTKWCAVQKDLWHVHRLQKHRLQSRQRAQAVNDFLLLSLKTAWRITLLLLFTEGHPTRWRWWSCVQHYPSLTAVWL